MYDRKKDTTRWNKQLNISFFGAICWNYSKAPKVDRFLKHVKCWGLVGFIHPSSLNPWLHPLVEAGADIFRLNCSHRRGGDFERVYPLIRQSAKELGKKAGDFWGQRPKWINQWGI